MVCESLGIDSIKFEFGNDRLAGAAFSSSFGDESAASLASYVVTGSFSTDLGGYINENPKTIDTILKFRGSRPGHALRTEIRDSLATAGGAEVVASINGGLRSVIPLSVLEAARTNFAQLAIVREEAKYPAIWYDAEYGAKALTLWRKRAAEELALICSKAGIGTYDQCPCGSGEKLRFCCSEALSK
jgi:hypothetical protein